MRRVALLGLVAASLLAACESSRDSLLNAGGGKGGIAGGGAGGSTSGTAGTGTAGTAGTGTAGTAGTGTAGTGAGGTGGRACQQALCARPYECVRTCGGRIEYSGCCACDAPLFDNFLNWACGGTTGTAGRGGSGGTAGTGGSTGGAGTSGGGTTGGAGTTGGRGGTSGSGGSTAGRGGTGGTSGTGGGAAGTGGTGPRACEQFQCARPYECVRTCGGRIEYTGCCSCDPPLFDDFNGLACGDGGQPRTGYAGCTFIGGYDRVVISRCDAAAGIALNIVLVTPTAQGMSTPALSVPASYALEHVAVSASINCPSRVPTGATITSISGTVTWADLVGGAGTKPAHANIDVSVTVQIPNNPTPLSATIRAQNVDVRPGCT